jgi:hypothetical protein
MVVVSAQVTERYAAARASRPKHGKGKGIAYDNPANDPQAYSDRSPLTQLYRQP